MPEQVWKCRERVKIKIIIPYISDRTLNRDLKKKAKKFKKLKKHHYDLFLMPEQVLKCRERVKIKIIIPFISDRTPNREFKKKKKQKNYKN